MRASANIEVFRPIDEVFDYVADVSQWEQWVEAVGPTRRVDGDGSGVGDVYEATYSGRENGMKFVVARADRPSVFAVTSSEGPIAFDGTLELTATPDGTHVTNTMDVERGGRLSKLMLTVFQPLTRRLFARQLRQELETLKTILEASPTSEREPAIADAP